MKIKQSIQQSKDTERHGLSKVPDDVIIKQLRIELGQEKAYSKELEDKIKAQKSTNPFHELCFSISSYEAQCNEIAPTINSLKGQKRMRMQAKLIELNAKIKEANVLLHKNQRADEYRQLQLFITEKFGNDVLIDFFNNHVERLYSTNKKSV